MTGASRLAARAAQRMGAGLVTLAAPSPVLPIYAGSLESVIVCPCDTLKSWQSLVSAEKKPALLIGPGLGIGKDCKAEILTALEANRPTVIDADGLTNFSQAPDVLFAALHPACILTPHEGEFARVFGVLEGDKIARTLAAARRANCIVLLKGSETIIAAPDGNVIVNRNASPWLATAGSGDVLAGMILGLVAQKMPLFEAAAAATWVHGRAASLHGPGLISEDLLDAIPAVLGKILMPE